MVNAVGIDLGTTNSVIGYCPHEGVPEVIRNADGEATTPSVIAFEPDEGLVVGREAVQTFGYGFSPGAALFKRQMGTSGTLVTHEGTGYGPEELSAILLGRLADDAAAVLGARPEKAVVTVPAYFGNKEREATRRAAGLAGLECLQLINEPLAAANFFISEHGVTPGRILVYDLGGGTFDVAIVVPSENELKVVAQRGDPNLGGADWDRLLMDLIAERAADVFDDDMLDDPALQLAFRREAEIAKLRLSAMPRVNVSLAHNGQSMQCTLTRSDFDMAAAGLVQATLAMTDEAMAAVEERGIGPEDIDHVILVGGSTRMPMIEQALETHFGKPPRKTVNPDEAVALGAALLADQLGRDRAAGLVARGKGAVQSGGLVSITDIANFSLGVVAVSEDGESYVNQIMIPRGASLPAKGVQSFKHVFRAGDTAQLEVYVTQGESTSPAEVGFIGLFTLDILPGVTDGKPSDIEISYSYDLSGIGSARARVVGQSEWVMMERAEVEDTAHARFADPPPKQKAPEPVSILMIFDVSGSMSGDPIKEARAAAQRFVDAFDPAAVEIGIGVVANETEILLEPTNNFRKVRRAIKQVEVNALGTGYGNDAHPFDRVRLVMSQKAGGRTAVILADGVWSDQRGAITAAGICHMEGVEIVAIGFGGADKNFLDAISSADELSLKVDQSELVAAFGSIAQVVSRRSGLISR